MTLQVPIHSVSVVHFSTTFSLENQAVYCVCVGKQDDVFHALRKKAYPLSSWAVTNPSWSVRLIFLSPEKMQSLKHVDIEAYADGMKNV